MGGSSYAVGLARLGLFLVLLNAFQPAIAPSPFRPELTQNLLAHDEDGHKAAGSSGFSHVLHSVTNAFAGFLGPSHDAPIHNRPAFSPSARLTSKLVLDKIRSTSLDPNKHRDIYGIARAVAVMEDSGFLNDEADSNAIDESIRTAKQAAKSVSEARNGGWFSNNLITSCVGTVQQAAEVFTAELEKLRKLEIMASSAVKLQMGSETIAWVPSAVKLQMRSETIAWLKTRMVHRRNLAKEREPILSKLVQHAKQLLPHTDFELNTPERNWRAFANLGYFPSNRQQRRMRVDNTVPVEVGGNDRLGWGWDGGPGPHRSGSSHHDQAGPSGGGTGWSY